MDFMASRGRAPRDLEFRLVLLLGVDVNRNDNSPKSLPIDLKNRQATKNTTTSQGKSILLRNVQIPTVLNKAVAWFPI